MSPAFIFTHTLVKPCILSSQFCLKVVGRVGLEPTTIGLKVRCSTNWANDPCWVRGYPPLTLIMYHAGWICQVTKCHSIGMIRFSILIEQKLFLLVLTRAFAFSIGFSSKWSKKVLSSTSLFATLAITVYRYIMSPCEKMRTSGFTPETGTDIKPDILKTCFVLLASQTRHSPDYVRQVLSKWYQRRDSNSQAHKGERFWTSCVYHSTTLACVPYIITRRGAGVKWFLIETRR